MNAALNSSRDFVYAHTYPTAVGAFRRKKAFRRNRSARLLALAAALLVCFWFGAFFHALAGDDKVQAAGVEAEERIVVKYGDTLWTIAEKHAPKDEDIRTYIQKLKKVNGLRTSALNAGQVLVLP